MIMLPHEDKGLAGLLAVDLDTVRDVLGARWRSEPGVTDEGAERWFVQGEPAQVAVGTDGREWWLAKPGWRWSGHADLVWRVEERRPFDPTDLLDRPEAINAVADDIARRRRKAFRWCLTCRHLEPPERFLRDEGVCMDCSNVVF
ncbi:hypothetical protein [Blastococcus sp. SYSU D00820]